MMITTYSALLLSWFAMYVINPTEALKSIYPQINTRKLFVLDTHSRMNSRFENVRQNPWSHSFILPESSTRLHAGMKFKNFEEMLMTFGDSLVIVTFSTSLCGPCRSMKKELGEVASLIDKDLEMFAIDMEKFPKLGTRYGVEILPTVVIFKGGEVIDRIEGVESAEKVIERLRTI
mmetsp:Transcript_25796/g.39019  ORF Transcript_25796/g.39019 Transcript_25796/m.39019 type:complete len:176 (-) Transcript_25796:1831-2358(-)